MVREGRVLTSNATRPAFGSNYMVTVYTPGARVAVASSGTVATVDRGHGFIVGDALIVATSESVDVDRRRIVTAVTDTTLTMTKPTPLAIGEFLVNLGPDAGVSLGGPDYDASRAVIYTDVAMTLPATDSTVDCASNGRYRYWHTGDERWELVRSGTGAAVALYIDTGQASDQDRTHYGVRYAHLFADGGSGTEAEPWTTSGSNPISAAYADLASEGAGGRGVIRLIPGCYSIGSGTTGIDINTAGASNLSGLTIEGYSKGYRASLDAGSNVGLVNYDAAVLLYSGAGAAIKIGDFASTGTTTAEGIVLSNFKIRQTGSKGTGVGVLARLVRSSHFADLNVTDFDTGIALASVSDFNVFDRITCNDCHSYGVDLARTTDESGNALPTPNGQCNGNTFNACYVCLTNRDSGYTAYGIRTDANAVKTVIRNCTLQNFDTSGYAAILVNSAVSNVTSNTTTVDSCYFEGNAIGCLFNNPNSSGTETSMLTFRDNYVTQIEQYGFFAQSGSTGLTDGIVVTGNTFTVPNSSAPYDAAIGVQLGTYNQNCFVMGNHFDIGNTTGTLPGGNIKHGALGTISQNNLVIGSHRVTGAVAFDAALAVGTTCAVGTDLSVSRYVLRSVAAAVTASTTQTQVGGTPLTKDINNVSVCANANDTVTLPSAAAGMSIVIFNNGAQTLKIYPASGDNLGAGVDTSTTLAAGSNVRYTAYDSTNWEAI